MQKANDSLIAGLRLLILDRILAVIVFLGLA